MRFRNPDSTTLTDRCLRAENVLISAPYYGSGSLKLITPSDTGRLEFWTRLNPYDWATGASDLEALLSYLSEKQDIIKALRVHKTLHAKIYLIDNNWAWVGSPNLSDNAFNRNIEIVCELVDNEVHQLSKFVNNMRKSLTKISLNDLRSFVEAAYDVVAEHHERGDIDVSEDMQAAVALADEILTPEVEWPKWAEIPSLEGFIAFLQEQPEDAAAVLVRRHGGENNLQGHVKQAYFGSILYLQDPDHSTTREELAEMDIDGLPRFQEEFIRSWQDFLDRYSRLQDKEKGFNLSVLRRILPEHWGGYTVSGGGGISTIKRMLPFVARFLRNH